jgi:hypothetical protein
MVCIAKFLWEILCVSLRHALYIRQGTESYGVLPMEAFVLHRAADLLHKLAKEKRRRSVFATIMSCSYQWS